MSDERWADAYRDRPAVYEAFSGAESPDGAAFAAFRERCSLAGETVLDLGSGTGAYTDRLAGNCARYYGLDRSRPMLDRAVASVGTPSNGAFVHASAAQVPFPDASVDTVFAAWCLTAIPDESRRAAADREVERVLRPGGEAWAVENYCTGEFMELREMAADPGSWSHPLTGYGYEPVAVVETAFEFPTLDRATDVFGFLFGESAVEHLEATGDPTVDHHVLLLRKSA